MVIFSDVSEQEQALFRFNLVDKTKLIYAIFSKHNSSLKQTYKNNFNYKKPNLLPLVFYKHNVTTDCVETLHRLQADHHLTEALN